MIKKYSNIKGFDLETYRGIPYLIGYYDYQTGEYKHIWMDVKHCRTMEYQKRLFNNPNDKISH